MAKRKTGKLKKKGGAHPAKSIPAQATAKKAPYDLILTCIVATYFLYYIISLFSTLSEVHFWADENVHAYISSVIFENMRLPALLPEEVYGGFEFSYPPFFHIMNAFVMAIGGFPALKFTNLILLILFLGGFFFLIRMHYGNDVALIACLLISLSPTVAINSVRFMTEILSMILVFLSFFSWLVAIKTGKTFYAIISGLSCGLLMLSKQIGIVVLSFYSLLFIWFYFKRRKDLKQMLYVIGTAVCVFTPYLIWALYYRIEVFGFVSLFLGNKPEWATMAVKSFRRYDSSLREFVTLFYTGNGFIISISFLLPLFHFIRTRAKGFPQNFIFLMSIYLTIVIVIWHITNPRHTIILLPLITFLFGYALNQIVINKTAIKIVILFLLIIASYSTYHMPNYRQRYNAPKEVIKMVEIIRKDDSLNGRTLFIFAFDYLMFTRKPVIWPYPNLRNIPVNLFDKQTPSKLYGLLKHYNIGLILIDMRFVSNTDEFMGRNYPLSFIRNCEILDKQGRLLLKALSDSNHLILLEVI